MWSTILKINYPGILGVVAGKINFSTFWVKSGDVCPPPPIVIGLYFPSALATQAMVIWIMGDAVQKHPNGNGWCPPGLNDLLFTE